VDEAKLRYERVGIVDVQVVDGFIAPGRFGAGEFKSRKGESPLPNPPRERGGRGTSDVGVSLELGGESASELGGGSTSELGGGSVSAPPVHGGIKGGFFSRAALAIPRHAEHQIPSQQRSRLDPFRAERRFRAQPALAANPFPDPFEVRFNLGDGHAQHIQSHSPQKGVAAPVMLTPCRGEMPAAIHLHDEMGVARIKVGHVGADRMLPPKFEPRQPAPQHAPKFSFGKRHLVPKLTPQFAAVRRNAGPVPSPAERARPGLGENAMVAGEPERGRRRFVAKLDHPSLVRFRNRAPDRVPDPIMSEDAISHAHRFDGEKAKPPLDPPVNGGSGATVAPQFKGNASIGGIPPSPFTGRAGVGVFIPSFSGRERVGVLHLNPNPCASPNARRIEHKAVGTGGPHNNAPFNIRRRVRDAGKGSHMPERAAGRQRDLRSPRSRGD
jgi:hypothetical protein